MIDQQDKVGREPPVLDSGVVKVDIERDVVGRAANDVNANDRWAGHAVADSDKLGVTRRDCRICPTNLHVVAERDTTPIEHLNSLQPLRIANNGRRHRSRCGAPQPRSAGRRFRAPSPLMYAGTRVPGFGSPSGSIRGRLDGVLIRERQDEDHPALDLLARSVHQLDGYPMYMPDDNFLAFLISDQALNGWVAVDQGQVVGHVALHRRSSPGVVALAASQLGLRASECGVVARLLVAPEQRRTGLGRRLLDHATDQCRRRQLAPILDVVDGTEPAIALYEHAGWRHLGSVTFTLPDGSELTEHVYAAPNQ